MDRINTLAKVVKEQGANLARLGQNKCERNLLMFGLQCCHFNALLVLYCT